MARAPRRDRRVGHRPDDDRGAADPRVRDRPDHAAPDRARAAARLARLPRAAAARHAARRRGDHGGGRRPGGRRPAAAASRRGRGDRRRARDLRRRAPAGRAARPRSSCSCASAARSGGKGLRDAKPEPAAGRAVEQRLEPVGPVEVRADADEVDRDVALALPGERPDGTDAAAVAHGLEHRLAERRRRRSGASTPTGHELSHLRERPVAARDELRRAELAHERLVGVRRRSRSRAAPRRRASSTA